MVYRRQGIVLKRREWRCDYVTVAMGDVPVTLVLCDLILTIADADRMPATV